MTEPWWKSAVVYQIYPRSFADSNGDGVGDLEGIRRHLDHLQWLGVDAIWVSPFYRSPMADFGYDVADYCDVDPIFGTLEDFDRLVEDAHARDLRVIVDWVPNHTSDQHPWFVECRSSLESPKRDWYLWVDGTPDCPPNNWKAAFSSTEPAWTWDEVTGQWYLHLFLPAQPDLNWRNPEVVEAMHDTLRFWLDRGVDGFRMDVVHALVKKAGFPDVDDPWLSTDRFDEPATHERIRGFRRLLDSYPGDRVSVGEVFILSTAKVAEYYGDNDELHLAFNFPPLFAPWDASKWKKRIDRVVEELEPRDAWPTWVLSNHDTSRHRTRYGGSEARARAAAVLLLTLRGTPFLYQGEELGLEDADVPPDRVVDPGGRDGARAPIPWTSEGGHGRGDVDPWLPFPPDAADRNPEAADADADSILHLYRRLLAARRASPALQLGAWTQLDAPEGVLAYTRAHDHDLRAVLVNYTSEGVRAEVAGAWSVEVASDGNGEGARYGGALGADQALVLRPMS
ncbi:MAG: putative glycosyl hydrolase, family 13 [Acidimicrobiales bacterium]|nr:putative glycosyl hydrolase, family 13 [Acidimicrobiales bacterium]